MRMKQIISKNGVLAIIERLKKQRLKSIIYIIVTNIFVVQFNLLWFPLLLPRYGFDRLILAG